MSRYYGLQDFDQLGDDDLDLEALMLSGNDDDTSQTDASSSSGAGDLLHESNESITSEEESHTTGKRSFINKVFSKSSSPVPTKRKPFGSHSHLASSSHNETDRGSMPPTPQTNSMLNGQVERLSSCKIPRNGSKQTMWSIWISDLGLWNEIELPVSSTCALLIHKLLSALHRHPDLTQWSIVEQNSETMIERFVEDYEIMDDLIACAESESISRFCLNKTPMKYAILQYPEQCLPEDMLTVPGHFATAMPHGNARRFQMQHILTKTAPEMCGWLYILEVGRRSWKKLYCILRNSGLYYSSKNTSKEPQHLVCVAEVHSARVWFPINNKKLSNNAPTTFSFCLKPRSFSTGSAIRWFCAETSCLRAAWISALRLTMNGSRFHESYLSARRCGPSNLIRSSSDRTINKYDANFVAMDFSGSTGRVIQDPLEATMVELEQQSSWRRRLMNRMMNNNTTGLDRGLAATSAPAREIAWFTRAIHQTQPWFYGKISREAAIEEIQRHGSLDGTFLVRDSRSIPGGVVITLCHNQKSRHIPITQLERDGQCVYTSDNGETRFLDLIQFVDFHRLNKGSLPCALMHECTRSYR